MMLTRRPRGLNERCPVPNGGRGVFRSQSSVCHFSLITVLGEFCSKSLIATSVPSHLSQGTKKKGKKKKHELLKQMRREPDAIVAVRCLCLSYTVLERLCLGKES